MTAEPLLSKRDLAAMRGVEVSSISHALSMSRRRLRDGLPLGRTNLPVPRDEDELFGRPMWRRTPELDAWLNRPRQVSRAAQSTGKDESC